MEEQAGYAELNKRKDEVKGEIEKLESEIKRLETEVKKKESEQKSLMSALKQYKKCPECKNLTHQDELKENNKMCAACRNKADEDSKDSNAIFNKY